MKKLLIALSVVASSVVITGCSDGDNAPNATSTRYSNVSILESTVKTGGAYRDGGIEIAVDAFDMNANVYAMVVPHGSEAPTEAQMKKGKDYGNVDIIGSYTGVGSVYEFVYHDDIEGHVEGNKYDCYATIEANGVFASTMYKTTVVTYTMEQLFDKGSGTQADPYRIYTVEDLETLGYITADRPLADYAYYKLMNNIDLSDKYNALDYFGDQELVDEWESLKDEWELNGYSTSGETAVSARLSELLNNENNNSDASFLPIGFLTGSRVKFRGHIDGDGFTINGLFQVETREGSGLMAELDAAGSISNLVLTNFDILTTTQRTAFLSGYGKGIMSNVVVLGCELHSTAGRAGAISGQMYEAGWVYNCYVDATIVSYATSNQHVGGIVGASAYSAQTTTISGCQFTGFIRGTSSVGGIAGSLTGTNVTKCFVFDATIIGSSSAYGIVASWSTKVATTLTYCATYKLSSTNNNLYAIRNSSTNVTDCYHVNGTKEMGRTGSTEKTEEEFLKSSFYSDYLAFSARTFNLVDGELPILLFALTSMDGNEYWTTEGSGE